MSKQMKKNTSNKRTAYSLMVASMLAIAPVKNVFAAQSCKIFGVTIAESKMTQIELGSVTGRFANFDSCYSLMQDKVNTDPSISGGYVEAGDDKSLLYFKPSEDKSVIVSIVSEENERLNKKVTDLEKKLSALKKQRSQKVTIENNTYNSYSPQDQGEGWFYS
jgi:hypothetical protein